ncbi:hypothetical protein EHZ19_16185 [Paraburkholderia bannensis]|nr:hypothetical protein [Paraburkholderia bannensis]RQM47190.1 hypothetical protein EHZ19_16185 [Paraburkholderia bannensis]
MKTSNRKLARSTQQPPPPPTEADVQLHKRYKSNWPESIIIIDVRHRESSVPDLRTYDLKNLFISGGGRKVIYSGVYPLSEFPNLCFSLKLALNKILFSVDSSTLDETIGAIIRTCLRIFSWMLQQDVTSLNALDRNDINSLSESVGRQGWWGTLRYEEEFKNLASIFESDISVSNELNSAEKVQHVSHMRINVSALERMIGLPVNPRDIPVWFRHALAGPKAYQPKHPKCESDVSRASGSEHTYCLRTLNALCLHPAKFDSIRFTPFVKINPEVRRFTKIRLREKNRTNSNSTLAPDSQSLVPLEQIVRTPTSVRATRNMSVDVTVKMLMQALLWIYDWRQPMLQILDLVRCELKNEIKSGNTRGYISKGLIPEINRILHDNKIPITVTTYSRRNQDPHDASIIDLVTTNMFSCAFVVAFNHGRRPNEVVGDSVPFGLYRGCVQEVMADYRLSCIEIYIEKQPREYATFWCTDLISDAVKCLEEIGKRFDPIMIDDVSADSEPNVTNELPPTSIQERRQVKLFRFRNFAPGPFSRENYKTLQWRGDSLLFFELAGVDPKIFENSHIPCRRMFMTYFVRRYDIPEVLALKKHFRDVSIESLRPYSRDPSDRPAEERIESILRARGDCDREIDDELRVERSQVLVELIERMMRGELLGGGFSRIIIKIIKKLSNLVSFLESPITDKSRDIAAEAERRGHALQEKENVFCMAGRARHTLRGANCYRHGSLHREEASPIKCANCIHGCTTPQIVTFFKEELDSLRQISENPRLPRAARLDAKKQADLLQGVIDTEMEISETNRKMFAKIVETWSSVYPDRT